MKILEINKFNFAKGGADRHFMDLTKLLRDRGNEVAVFAMEHSKNEFSPWKKYFVSYVGYNHGDSTLWQKIKGTVRMFYSLESRKKISRLLDDFRPDIVHIHNIYHQISPSILSVIKKRGLPIVMTVHDYSLVCPDYLMDCNGKNWEEIKQKGWIYFVKNKCFKNSYLKSFLAILRFRLHKRLNIYDKNIDLYISPSQFTKNILVKNGLKENKIMVLPHFYARDSLEEKSQVNIRKKYVLYAGIISKNKGIKELVDVFQNIKNISLYLAGRKEEGFTLKKRENIKYIGFLSHKELSRYIKNALFLVSFSRLPETFGLIALDAISNGKPFIGFDSGAYGEIIKNAKSGYICKDLNEMKEKIEKLSNDEKLRNLFSQNALKKAQEFNQKQYGNDILSRFDMIIQNKKQRLT